MVTVVPPLGITLKTSLGETSYDCYYSIYGSHECRLLCTQTCYAHAHTHQWNSQQIFHFVEDLLAFFKNSLICCDLCTLNFNLELTNFLLIYRTIC